MPRYMEGIPFSYPAKVGELVWVRRSSADVYTKALIWVVAPRFDGRVRYDFLWAEDNPDTFTPIVRGTAGHVYVNADRWPPMIQEIR